jgi:hypothetical protein
VSNIPIVQSYSFTNTLTEDVIPFSSDESSSLYGFLTHLFMFATILVGIILLIIKIAINNGKTADILERLDVHFFSLSTTYHFLTFATLLNLNYGSSFGGFMNQIHFFYSRLHIPIYGESFSLEGKYAIFDLELLSVNTAVIPVGIFFISLIIRLIVNVAMNKKSATVERVHNLVTIVTFARSMVALLINVAHFSTTTTMTLISSIASAVFIVIYILEAVRIASTHLKKLIAKNRAGDSRLVYFTIIGIRFLLISALIATLGTKTEEIVAWTILAAVIASSVIIASLSKPKIASKTTIGKMTTTLSFICEVATIVLAVTLAVYSLDPTNKMNDTLSTIIQIISGVAFCTIVIAAAINFFINAYLVFKGQPKEAKKVAEVKKERKMCKVGDDGDEMTIKNRTYSSKPKSIMRSNSSSGDQKAEPKMNASMKKATLFNKKPEKKSKEKPLHHTRSKYVEVDPLADMMVSRTRTSRSQSKKRKDNETKKAETTKVDSRNNIYKNAQARHQTREVK